MSMDWGTVNREHPGGIVELEQAWARMDRANWIILVGC